MRLIITLAVLAFTAGPIHLHAEDHAGHDHADQDHGTPKAHADDEKPPHGGILKEVGDDHLELVSDAVTGSLTLYVLNGQLQALAIAAKPLTVQAKPAGSTVLIPVVLVPAAGDTAHTFTGSAEALKSVRVLDVIVRLELDGKNQRVVFSTAAVVAPEKPTKAIKDSHDH